jgi:lipopolysaccharide transport system permease protein
MDQVMTFEDLELAPPSLPQAPVVRIRPTTGWSSLRLPELWEYRDLLYFLVWRDLKARYRQNALGPIWIVLGPLFNMVIYTVIFGLIAKLPSQGQPYAIYTYTALLPWTFFAGAVASTTGCLLESRQLIAKVYFPRLLLPLSLLLSSLVDFAVSFLILLGLMAYYRIAPTWGVVLIPGFLLLAAVTGVGVGLWFAGLVVRYRDFGQISGMLVRVWMYATPVVYAMTLIPAQWLTVYQLNPMTGVINGFRWALLGTPPAPDWTLLASACIALPVFVGGLFYFRRAERNIVDVI